MNQENISAFADGEISKTDLDAMLASMTEPAGHACWDLYHQIGDAIRVEPLVNPVSSEFSIRFAVAFAAEPALVPARFPWLDNGPLAPAWHTAKSTFAVLERVLNLKRVGRFLHLS